MKDSLSMFEWGLYQIEDSLAEKKFKELDLIFRTITNTRH
jgi:hypothetical protein